MEDYNLAVLVDAKTEYTNQLINLCKKQMYTSIQHLFKTSKKECEDNSNPIDTLSMFQTKLAEIPSWDAEKIKTEYNQLVISSNCDWLDELLTAVFMSHSRILSSVHSNPNNPQVSLDIPNFQDFMHQCYIDIARCFWKSPYLFDDTVSSYDYQRNRRDCELMIEKTIGESLRRQLPVKHLLKKYLGNDIKEMKQTSIENDTNQEEQENLRNMVKKEIKLNTTETNEEVKEVENKTETECENTVETETEEPVVNNDNIVLDIVEEPSLTGENKEEKLNEKVYDTKEIENINLSQEMDLPFDIELEDLTSSLQDQGAVYGLLEPDELDADIKKEVNDELQSLIEKQDQNIKKVKLTEEPIEKDVTVTKMNNPEYNFFKDAAPHYVE